jgi:hypothetical protein
MYYPERPQNRRSVSGVLLFAIGLFLGALLILAGKPTIENQNCVPKTVVQTVTVTKEVCTATVQETGTGTFTGSAVPSYGFPTPAQATTASQTLSLQLSYPTADTINADWVVFSGKVTKNNKAGAYYVTFWANGKLALVLRTDFNGTFSYKFTRLPTEGKSTINVTVYAVDSDGKSVSNIISKVIGAP